MQEMYRTVVHIESVVAGFVFRQLAELKCVEIVYERRGFGISFLMCRNIRKLDEHHMFNSHIDAS